MNDQDILDGALLVARVWVGVVMLAHGWRHLQSVRSGPGMANWFESLGLKPGKLHAWNVTLTELADIMIDLGATTAYNLDGGGSSTMYFNGEVVNSPSNGGERATSDILYIAG